MSILGFPVFRYIDVDTPGGLVLASLQIARAIHQHKGKVTAVVPHYAMSGGTLIALAAAEIVMSEYAVIGPVDPQVGQYSAASVLKAVSRKPIERVNDETLILADQAEKAMPQVRDAVRELLADKLPNEKADQPGVEYLPEHRRAEGPPRPPQG